MTDEELLLDACYAYEDLAGLGGMTDKHREAYKKIRARLAQPEPEPVAWMYVNSDGECEQIEYGEPFDDPSVTPLYTAPPQRKECLRCGEINPAEIHTCTPQRDFRFSTTEEANQTIPMTKEQSKLTDDEKQFAHAFITLIKAGYRVEAEIVFKANRREWVGLTEDDLQSIYENICVSGASFNTIALIIEAKLKEKNA